MNALACDESAGKQDGRRPITGARWSSIRHIVDTIADNSDALANGGAVGGQQLLLALRETDDAVCTVDRALLMRPLPDALRRPRPELVLGAIKWMDRIDQRHVKPLA